MNEVFNINRFAKFGKRYVETHLEKYFFTLLIIGGYTIIGITLYTLGPKALLPISFFILSSIVPLTFITIALTPCFFEKNRNKGNELFDYILPASTFEKFLTKLINYTIIIPILAFGTVYFVTSISELIFNESAAKFIHKIDSFSSDDSKRIIYVTLIVQSIYWVGFNYFKRYSFFKTTLVMMGLFLTLILIDKLVIICIFENLKAYDIAMRSLPIEENINLAIRNTNKIREYIHITRTLLPIGLWIISFFKIRETEI